MRNYKIVESSAKKRIGKTIEFNRPVSTFTQNGLLKEHFINIEFEGKIYNAEIVSQNNSYKTAFLMNQSSNHANANIRLTLEPILN